MISTFLSNSSWLCYWTIAWALVGPIFFAKYIHDPQYGLEVGLSSSWATGFWTFACYWKICSICFHTLLPPLSEKQTGALQVFVSYLMFQKPKPAKHSKLTTFDLKKQQRLNNLKASDVSTAWQHQPFQCKDPQVASNRWQVSRSPTSLPRVFGLTCLVPSRTPTGGGGECFICLNVKSCQMPLMVYLYIFYVHPHLGKIPSMTSIFFKWVGSTTQQFLLSPMKSLVVELVILSCQGWKNPRNNDRKLHPPYRNNDIIMPFSLSVLKIV